jgi:hypothetical protein
LGANIVLSATPNNGYSPFDFKIDVTDENGNNPMGNTTISQVLTLAGGGIGCAIGMPGHDLHYTVILREAEAPTGVQPLYNLSVEGDFDPKKATTYVPLLLNDVNGSGYYARGCAPGTEIKVSVNLGFLSTWISWDSKNSEEFIWEADGVVLKSKKGSEQTFVMPANDVTITVYWPDFPLPDSGIDSGGIYTPDDTSGDSQIDNPSSTPSPYASWSGSYSVELSKATVALNEPIELTISGFDPNKTQFIYVDLDIVDGIGYYRYSFVVANGEARSKMELGAIEKVNSTTYRLKLSTKYAAKHKFRDISISEYPKYISDNTSDYPSDGSANYYTLFNILTESEAYSAIYYSANGTPRTVDIDFEIDVLSTTIEKPSTWAETEVNAALAAKLVPLALQSKYTQATTRAEFCALAVALYETATGKTLTDRVSFDDTTDANVEKAAAIAVVNGVGGNNFAPDAELTLEQAATMLSRLADAIGKPLTKTAATFADNGSVSSWAMEGVGQVQAAGVMGGVGDNTFAPQNPYTREQSIMTILRLYHIVK